MSTIAITLQAICCSSGQLIHRRAWTSQISKCPRIPPLTKARKWTDIATTHPHCKTRHRTDSDSRNSGCSRVPQPPPQLKVTIKSFIRSSRSSGRTGAAIVEASTIILPCTSNWAAVLMLARFQAQTSLVTSPHRSCLSTWPTAVVGHPVVRLLQVTWSQAFTPNKTSELPFRWTLASKISMTPV